MIWHIILGIWLIPAIIAVPVIILLMMLEERSFLPFDVWYEILIIPVISIGWPIILGIEISEYRVARKKKLAEVQETIEAHYRDRWYE